jgi:hypothetical protein
MGAMRGSVHPGHERETIIKRVQVSIPLSLDRSPTTRWNIITHPNPPATVAF